MHAALGKQSPAILLQRALYLWAWREVCEYPNLVQGTKGEFVVDDDEEFVGAWMDVRQEDTAGADGTEIGGQSGVEEKREGFDVGLCVMR